VAATPRRKHVNTTTHVAFLHALNGSLTEAGDEGVAGTSKRRGVASTLAQAESLWPESRKHGMTFVMPCQ
jgi:hypothetical protein